MSLLIAGTIRVPAENLEKLRPHMLAVLAANRAEDGCLTFSFALDPADTGLIHVFEVWRDQAALDAHGKSAHLAEWRRTCTEYGVSDRQLTVYDIVGERPL